MLEVRFFPAFKSENARQTVVLKSKEAEYDGRSLEPVKHNYFPSYSRLFDYFLQDDNLQLLNFLYLLPSNE